MSLPGCPKLPLLGLTVWCATLASPVSAALIAYWNFNTLSTTGGLPSNANVTSYVPSTGTGSLTLTGWSSRAGTSAPHGISNFAGSATNAIAPDLAVQSLALQASNASSGTPNNGAVAMFQFDLTGYADPVFSFATQGTATGFNSNQVAYSTDGTNFTNFGTAYVPVASFLAPAGLQSFDFSSVDVLDQSATVYVRITFTGSTGSSGNNRLDNIQLNATVVPEASTGLLATALGLLTLRRRR